MLFDFLKPIKIAPKGKIFWGCFVAMYLAAGIYYLLSIRIFLQRFNERLGSLAHAFRCGSTNMVARSNCAFECEHIKDISLDNRMVRLQHIEAKISNIALFINANLDHTGDTFMGVSDRNRLLNH